MFVCRFLQRMTESAVKFFLVVIIAISLLSSFICLVVFGKYYPNVFSFKDLIFVLPAIAIVCLTWVLGKVLAGIKNKYIFFIMTGIQIFLAVLVISTYNTQPCSDYKYIWEAAIEYASGNYSAGTIPNNYMHIYNWQIGIAWLESIVLRIFGEHFIVLKILNSIIMVTASWCIYCLCNHKWGKQIACYAYSGTVLLLPWFLSIPQFTNHHATILLLLLILFLLDSENIVFWGIAGVSAAILNVLRAYGIIILLSAIVLSIYRICNSCSDKYSRRGVSKHIFALILFLVSYFFSIWLLDQYFIHIGAYTSKLSVASVPYFKFQKGLYGLNSPADGLKAYGWNYELYNQAMHDELISVVKANPKEVIVFVANKMCRYLGLFDYQFEMTYNHDEFFYTQLPVRALYCISWFQYIIMLALSLFGLLRHRLFDVNIHSIFFIGNTLVYLLIEAFSSYRFESYPFLIILTAHGFLGLSVWIKEQKGSQGYLCNKTGAKT